MRLLFRLRTGLVWLLEDKKGMVSDESVLCVIAEYGEDVAHFLVGCGEFERDWLMLLDDVCRIVGAREWVDEFWRVDEEGKVWHCCWEKEGKVWHCCWEKEGKGWRAYVTE